MESKTVKVPNISCGHCVKTIEREIGGLDGVVLVEAKAESKTVKVEWNEPPASWNAIKSLLEEINYPPEGRFPVGEEGRRHIRLGSGRSFLPPSGAWT